MSEELQQQEQEEVKKRRRLTGPERQYILDNAFKATDNEIAAHLKCSPKTIENIRLKHGLKKQATSAQSIKKYEAAVQEKVSTTLNTFSEDELYEYFRTKFTNSVRYKRVAKLVGAEELEMFVDDWCRYHILLEDVNFAEENQIEQLILTKLRIFENQKQYKKYLETAQYLMDNHQILSLDDLDTSDPEQDMVYNKIEMAQTMASTLNKSYQELLDKFNDLFKTLNITRQQRESKGKIGGDTFFSKCQEFTKKAYRDKEGRNVELLKLATENNMNKLREGITFADGETAPQLLDDVTVEIMEQQGNIENESEGIEVHSDSNIGNQDEGTSGST